jgi:hypothetical protein
MDQNLEQGTERHNSYILFEQVQDAMSLEAQNEMDVENDTVELFSDRSVRFPRCDRSNTLS